MQPDQMLNELPPRPSFMMNQPPAQQMATPEEIQALKDMLDAAQKKMDDLNASTVAETDLGRTRRNSILRTVFDKLKLQGVDLNDPLSVSAFLENLRTKNPEVARYFEEAMDELLGKEIEDVEALPEETTEVEGLQF